MIRWLYGLLMWLAQPLLRRKLIRRGLREPGYLEAMQERFGHYSNQSAAPAGSMIWIHAVSLGETRAAAVLLATLRQRWPQLRLLLTHGTATGRAEGRQLLRSGDVQVWQPWDTPAAAGRFLDHFQPRIGILMETEIWPNLVHACRQRGLPLALANARLSDKSLQSARRLAWLARPAYQALSAVWAQTQQDAARFAELGVHVQGVFGNLKFDATPDARQLVSGRAWRAQACRAVAMLASSRPGEEAALLQILASFMPATPVDTANAAIKHIALEVPVKVTAASPMALQWLIVPRHPQRFDEVAALIEANGFKVSRRSTWEPAPEPDANLRTIWLGDSMGEMALYYALADVALLGGSFEPLGGQNLIEAAACGCPVLMGPHTFNFARVAEQALAAGAAQRAGNLAAAISAAVELTHNDTQLNAARAAALAFANMHRGASQHLALAIEHLLKPEAAGSPDSA